MPLVSVVVLTYNSAKTVIDTLDSIAKQTYNNIELIITDDSSKDDTISVVNSWVARNKELFIRVEVIVAPINSGVTANASRGVEVSNGEWVKVIAGDDMLKPNAIEHFMSVASKGEGDLFFSRMDLFSDDPEKDLSSWTIDFFERAYSVLRRDLSAKEQYEIMRYSNNYCPAPAAFFSRNVFDSVGGYDTSIAMAEDMPLWLRCAESGCRFNFIDEQLVCYRIGEGSVQGSKRFSVTRRLIKYKYLLKIKDYGIYKHIKQLTDCGSMSNSVLFVLLKIMSAYHIYLFQKEAELVSKKYGVEKKKIT